MDIYTSHKNMLERLTEMGWTMEKTTRGELYHLKPQEGIGVFCVWEIDSSLFFFDLDLMYKQTKLILNYSDVVGVQITFIENNEIEYYKQKDQIETTRFGSFCYVNNVCVPWIKKYPADSRICALTLIITDRFLKQNHIFLSLNDWHTFARAINNRSISLPSLSAILKQIKYTKINEAFFPIYFKTKAIEAFLLLWDYSKKQKLELKRINTKSYTAVENCLNILSKNYISPPIIVELAKKVGIDKKTLQFTFKEIVGLSIHRYIRTLRMQQSLLLLKESDLSIERIAKKVGYNSKIHFYNAFKTTFGILPSEMRKIIKE